MTKLLLKIFLGVLILVAPDSVFYLRKVDACEPVGLRTDGNLPGRTSGSVSGFPDYYYYRNLIFIQNCELVSFMMCLLATFVVNYIDFEPSFFKLQQNINVHFLLLCRIL